MVFTASAKWPRHFSLVHLCPLLPSRPLFHSWASPPIPEPQLEVRIPRVSETREAIPIHVEVFFPVTWERRKEKQATPGSLNPGGKG